MIKVKLERYTYATDGPYDSITTSTSCRSIVTIHNIVKCFDHDPYLRKAKEWVNKTFAEEKYNQMHATIKENNKTIEDLKMNNLELENRLNTFLVEVEAE